MITFIRHTEAEKVEYNGRNERQRNTHTDRQTDNSGHYWFMDQHDIVFLNGYNNKHVFMRG